MTTDEARMRNVLTDCALTVSTFVMRASCVIRHSSFVIPTLVVAICGIVAASEAGEFPAFEYHRIDNIGSLLGQTALADIDRDGDLDWVVGESASRGGTIWWWEYQAADRWIRHPLGTGRTDVGGSLYDVDGDGWLDMFSGTRILINSREPRAKAFREFDIGTASSHDSVLAEINGDGRMDALANSDTAGLFWYEIPPDPTKTWISHTIATAESHKIHGGISPQAVGDIDGDGDHDVVTGQAWYENADGQGIEWRQHKNIDFGEHDRYGLAVRTWVGDLDGDRDVDVVQAEADHPDARVAWFENDGHGTWTRHLIKDKGQRQDFHSLVVADFDLDGDLDVFSGGGPLSEAGQHKCYVWENRAGANAKPVRGQWVEHIIARMPCHEAVGGDVDGDGDVDICSKPWSTGNEHFFLKNLLKESGQVGK